ncbi:cell division protein SepF [Nesterenkonia sp. NBAIMH1]|uniref:cell division protein SepF n=1 Tax=Nesterenkonia sp. NBAIMH1 TaxID=2600320 RepID=UPI0011B722F8|nr:cell division protein SepF [Nesterenkonia sp. NBAIMH1]
MAGAFKKTMIYLGLADGDDYAEDSFGSEDRSPRSQQSSAAERPAETRQPAAAAPAPSAAHSREAVSAESARDNVVSLSERQPAGQMEHHTGSYNSTNLAVDPDYRAPVTPIKRAPSSRDESEPMRKITTVHPRSYNDAKVIGESFREDIPVIMNVTEMGEAEAKRLVDFAAGLVFGLGGSIERVTNKVFLLTPKNVEILAEEQAALAEPDAQFFNQS